MGKVFQFRMRKGKAVGAQPGFADAFNRVLDILENIDGRGGVEIRKNGIDWRIVVTDDTYAGPGGIPEGYEEETVIVDMQWDATGKSIQVKTATALLKSGTTSDWTDKIEFAQFDD